MVCTHGEVVTREDPTITVPKNTVVFQTAELGQVSMVGFDSFFAKMFETYEDARLTTNVIFGNHGAKAEHLLSGISFLDKYHYFRAFFPSEITANKALMYDRTEIEERNTNANPDNIFGTDAPWGVYQMRHYMNQDGKTGMVMDHVPKLGTTDMDALFAEETTTSAVMQLINANYKGKYNFIFFSSCSVIVERELNRNRATAMRFYGKIAKFLDNNSFFTDDLDKAVPALEEAEHYDSIPRDIFYSIVYEEPKKDYSNRLERELPTKRTYRNKSRDIEHIEINVNDLDSIYKGLAKYAQFKGKQLLLFFALKPETIDLIEARYGVRPREKALYELPKKDYIAQYVEDILDPTVAEIKLAVFRSKESLKAFKEKERILAYPYCIPPSIFDPKRVEQQALTELYFADETNTNEERSSAATGSAARGGFRRKTRKHKK